jgi:hypothetical protein
VVTISVAVARHRHQSVPSGQDTFSTTSDKLPRPGDGVRLTAARLPGMNSALTSLIAVIGTLAGSGLTYVFGQLTTRRTERVMRHDRLRLERIKAYTTFAGALTDLRQALISLWFLKRGEPDAADARAARAEADKRGAAAHHARFSIQLLTEDAELLRLADRVFEPVDGLIDAKDRSELKALEERSEELLAAFIQVAGRQVR